MPFVVYMKEAREAGVPERVAFRRYAKRMREDIVRCVERRVREQLHPGGRDESALREDLERERRRADRLGFGEEHDVVVVDGPGGRELSGERGMFRREADAEFVAHAREDVPWLVGALEAALAELEGLQRQRGRRDRSAEPLPEEEAARLADEAVHEVRSELWARRRPERPALSPVEIREWNMRRGERREARGDGRERSEGKGRDRHA